MTKKWLLNGLAAGAFMLAGISTANSATIDFETSVAVGDTLTESGVTITSDSGENIAFSNPFGSRTLLSSSGPDPDFWRATFASFQGSVSIDLGDFGADTDEIFIDAFDSSNALVDSASQILLGSFSGLVTLSVSAVEIARVEFGTRQGGIFADNLVFEEATSVVPLPAAFPLLAGGLGFMGLMGWRRRRKIVGAAA